MSADNFAEDPEGIRDCSTKACDSSRGGHVLLQVSLEAQLGPGPGLVG